MSADDPERTDEETDARASEETLEGRRVPPRDPPRDDGGPAPSTAQRVLGWGSAGILGLGLALMARDVFAHERSGQLWLPLVAGTAGLVAAAVWHAIDAPRPVRRAILPPREPRRRRAIVAGVALLFVAQALIPLRYYLGDDRYDERFSWRMFSAVRVYRCRLNAFETTGGVERPKRLMATVHEAWVTNLRRNREDVMRRYLRWRCEQEGVEGARLLNRCVSPEGERVPDVVRRIDCATGAIEAEGGQR